MIGDNAGRSGQTANHNLFGGMMETLRKGMRVKVFIPQTNYRGPSQFHNRKWIVSYRDRANSSRWFVRLDGDPEGIDTEFLRSELVIK